MHLKQLLEIIREKDVVKLKTMTNTHHNGYILELKNLADTILVSGVSIAKTDINKLNTEKWKTALAAETIAVRKKTKIIGELFICSNDIIEIVAVDDASDAASMSLERLESKLTPAMPMSDMAIETPDVGSPKTIDPISALLAAKAKTVSKDIRAGKLPNHSDYSEVKHILTAEERTSYQALKHPMEM